MSGGGSTNLAWWCDCYWPLQVVDSVGVAVAVLLQNDFQGEQNTVVMHAFPQDSVISIHERIETMIGILNRAVFDIQREASSVVDDGVREEISQMQMDMSIVCNIQLLQQ